MSKKKKEKVESSAKAKATKEKPKKKKKTSEGGGAKAFFAEHVEKILFGVALAISALLIFMGFGNRQGIDSGKTPSALSEQVTRATGNIDSTAWDAYMNRDKDQNLLERAANTLKPMEGTAYRAQQNLSPPVNPPRTKRSDPNMLAAIDLQVRPGYGALIKETNMGRPTMSPDGSAAVPDVFQTEEDPYADEDFTDTKKWRDLPATYQGNLGRGGMPGGGMMGRGGEGAYGRRPGGGMGGSGAGKGVYFVAVTGLVPFKEQLKQYQDAFLKASGFVPQRDVPNYVTWVLERAEVRDGSPDRQWQKITMANAAEKEAELSGRRIGGGERGMPGMGNSGGSDNVDPRYVDANLTRPVPNILTHNMDRLARHDRVPSYDEFREIDFNDLNKPEEQEQPPAGEADALFGEQLPTVSPGGGRGFGGEGYAGRGEAGPPMGEGYGAGPPMGGDYGAGPPRGEGYGAGPPGGEGYGAGPPRGEGYGSGGRGMPMGEMGGSRFGRQAGMGAVMGDTKLDDPQVPEFKMFRYIDLDVEQGKTYVYRLRVYLEDPNYPAQLGYKPNESALEGAVAARVRKQQDADAEKARGKHKFYLATELSEESQPVTVSQGMRLLAGPVTPVRRTSPRNSNLSFTKPGDSPTATAMALIFDEQQAADIPGETVVERGSVANFTLDKTEMLVPAVNKLQKLQNQRFNLDITVVDIRGGESYTRFDELNVPGELLIMDKNGRLSIRNELQDAEDFQRNVFPPDVPMAGGEGGMRGGYGGEGGIGPPPGEGGRGGR